MKRPILTAVLLLFAVITFSQSSLITIPGGTDSADYFFQKGLQEKQNGRRLESLKYFEKAVYYNAKNGTVSGTFL